MAANLPPSQEPTAPAARIAIPKTAASAAAVAPAALPAEATWAVVVVHGVGETGPGQTLDAFLPALIAQSKGNLRETTLPEVRMLFANKQNPKPPVPPYPIPPLKPHDPPDAAPLAERFPMSVRRVEVRHPQPGTPARAVFAEVYWADLSAPGEGVLNLLRQLFTIIFHLRFVADQGAELDNFAARCFRLVVFWASWLLCGPIAALNVAVLYLVAIHFLIQNLRNWVEISQEGSRTILCLATLVGVAAACFGMYYSQKHRWGNPWRLIFIFAGVWSGLIALAAFVHFDTSGYLASEVGHRLLAWTEGDPFYIYTSLLLLVMRLFFALLGILVYGAFILWVIALCATWGGQANRYSLLGSFSVLLLQLGMWSLLVPAVAVYAFHSLDYPLLNASRSPLVPIVQIFQWHLLLALVVVVLLFFVVVLRTLWPAWDRRVNQPPQYDKGRLHVHTIPRLIVHRILLGALIVLSLGDTFISLWDETIKVRHLFGQDAGATLVETLFSWPPLAAVTGTFLNGTTLVLVAFAILGYFSRDVRAVGHILMDIVSHFYRVHFRMPSPVGTLKPLDIGGFLVQQQIEARLRRVLQEMKSLGNVTHLTVVSHSQGTVISVDVLWYPWTGELLAGSHVRLVTMGSPMTHLYQHYFPRRYPSFFDDKGKFNELVWGNLYDTVREWINIYRVDDFIGTYVEGALKNGNPWPDNQPVIEKGYNGHNDYWIQPKVLALMRPYLPG